MPAFNVEFKVFCEKCNAGICQNVLVDDGRMRLTIEPCELCLERAKEDGHEDGFEEGKKEGYEEGHEEGAREAVEGKISD